ncbi:acyl-CoA thioesterase domain-containing protein [uncultured Caulobacter sp.]|mgnify:CR=1 FL=1|uniref:acyl-CoA thioesterase domain-containing protein n=1 Tax=uncultured Caulobacter sp. TaxID=158749 RepID=UPI00261BD07B|nr:acyl-CoA thioesterase domain-containing protein [uncultured Caulobacter sp.]
MDTSLSAQLEAALREIAGDGAALTSLTIDFAAEAQEGALERRAWVERATRSLVFAQGELRRPNGSLAASASAVFRRAGD